MLVDAHPRLTRPLEGGKVPLISDPTVPLFITEGVPEGYAAVTIGLCCIAVLDVWNFRGTNESGGKPVLADWDSVALNDRFAYIVFDSDVMEKREVHAALVRLKALLESRKANVRLIYIPAGEKGEKVGLDDLLADAKASGRSDAEVRGGLFAMATPEMRKPTSPANDSSRPEIFLAAGQMPGIVDNAEKVLIASAARLGIFQRASEVVRIIAVEREIDRDGLRRPAGNVQLAPVSTLNLQETFDRLIAWKRDDPKNGDKPADCPAKIPAMYLARGEWRLPGLTGIIEAPVMRPDGTILSAPGFDESTGLYLHGET